MYKKKLWAVHVSKCTKIGDSVTRHPNKIYLEYQSVCPFFRIGSTNYLFSSSKCVGPLATKRGGATLACVWEGGGSQFGRLERKPGTLSTLCRHQSIQRKQRSKEPQPSQPSGCTHWPRWQNRCSWWGQIYPRRSDRSGTAGPANNLLSFHKETNL